MFFFFSSRRRHTRFDCDWSSDVCSSDLKKTMHLNSMIAGLQLPTVFITLSMAEGSWKDLYDILRKTDNHDTIPTNRRSEEHTSELQSHSNLVCRLLLEKKK